MVAIPARDLAALKREQNLLALVPGLQRIASTRGGEYAGPCPFCGGADRFHVQPHLPEGGQWMCRQCSPDGKWQDVIAFVQRRDGCTFAEAVARLGGPTLTPVPRSPEKVSKDLGPILATYDYQDEGGAPLFQVVRYAPKTFRQRRSDGRGGWQWGLGDVRRVLYHLPELVSRPDDPVWLVEGEKDADALMRLGELATTNPHGARSWHTDYTAALAGRRVIFVPDRDAEGEQHEQRVVAALAPVAAALRVVHLPQGKDVSDWLEAGRTLDELIALAKAAPDLAHTPADPPAAGRWPILSRADVAALPPPVWLIPGLLETGTVALLYGETGIGKTFITLDMALAVATGLPWWGQPVKPGPVLYVLAEGASGLDARLKAWELSRREAAANIFFITATIDLMDPTTAADLAQALPTAPALIVVDTLARSIGQGDENSNSDMSRVMNTATALQHLTGATVMIVHHSGKAGDRGPRGASAIPAACDTILKLSEETEVLHLYGEKQRNADSSDPWRFTRKTVTVGVRADSGEPLTSCAIELAHSTDLQITRLNERQRRVLEVLSGHMAPASYTEIQKATEYQPGQVYRLLDALIQAGLVDVEGEKGSRDRRYFITPAGSKTLTAATSHIHNIHTDSQNAHGMWPDPTFTHSHHSHTLEGVNDVNVKVIGGTGSEPGRVASRPLHPCPDCGNVSWQATQGGAWACGLCGTVATKYEEPP